MYPQRGGTKSRGRGAYRGGSRSWIVTRNLQIPETPAPELGKLLKSIQAEDLEESHMTIPKISSCKELTSYSWLSSKDEPTILIPGTPPRWTPPKPGNERTLQEDSGTYYRDQNAARFPRHPMQPAVEALLASANASDLKDIDLVACGNTLGNLLRFVRNESKPVRMVVEAVGDTVFFIRRENSPTEIIQGVYGYGHTMPEEYTTWNADVKGSLSHQRLLSYDFAGLHCIIRFEADGYLDFLVKHDHEPVAETQSKEKIPDASSSGNELSSALSNAMGLFPKVSGNQSEHLFVQKGTNPRIPQEALFDLKTRSIKKKGNDILGEQLPRLWVNQVPRQVVAYHTRGRFDMHNIDILNVQEDVEEWEAKNERALRKLSNLLREIMKVAKNQSNRRIEIQLDETSTLKVREVGGVFNKCLSDEIEEEWTEATSSFGGEEN